MFDNKTMDNAKIMPHACAILQGSKDCVLAHFLFIFNIKSEVILSHSENLLLP